ncbi:SCP2 domain-containing protein [Herminiimonas sp. CN]|uniref:ubiquinone biosynthesis accessory factor UbiJ n=1 Tax=Herminiimonas sp. CN TaxID=1349818 RepID=UPI000473AB5A|nr:SCP2 sterol-binding domain-containing protein [Herminiimonas sp. CN]
MTPSALLPAILPAAINHLLAQEPWARDKLAAHAGKVACFDAGLLNIRLKVAPGGLLEAAEPEIPAAVTIRAQAADLPLMLQNRERAFSYVQIEGDADFANAISQLSQTLRWEAEHDLSRLVGDIAAVRIVGGARAAARNVQSGAQSLAASVAEYLLEENPTLLRPQAVSDFGREVARMRDDVERLAKRIEKLQRPQS